MHHDRRVLTSESSSTRLSFQNVFTAQFVVSCKLVNQFVGNALFGIESFAAAPRDLLLFIVFGGDLNGKSWEA